MPVRDSWWALTGSRLSVAVSALSPIRMHLRPEATNQRSRGNRIRTVIDLARGSSIGRGTGGHFDGLSFTFAGNQKVSGQSAGNAALEQPVLPEEPCA